MKKDGRIHFILHKNFQKMLDKSEPPTKLSLEEGVKPITLEEGVKGEEYRYAYPCIRGVKVCLGKNFV